MPKSKTLPQVFIITPRRRKLPIPPQQHFLKILFFPAEREEDYGVEEIIKINLQRYWSQVLINSTTFATFTFLVSVLLCHNLASGMLKCEGFLT